MKRLNPTTNKQFQQGDIREDGYVFWAYDLKTIKKDGYFKERWYSPKSFTNNKNTHNKLNTISRTTAKGRADKLVSACKKRAQKKNLPFDLTSKDLLPILEKGICELSGLPFNFEAPKDSYTNPYAPSVDRIDNKKGYTKDNIRLVLSAINIALNDHGLDTMLPIFKALLK